MPHEPYSPHSDITPTYLERVVRRVEVRYAIHDADGKVHRFRVRTTGTGRDAEVRQEALRDGEWWASGDRITADGIAALVWVLALPSDRPEVIDDNGLILVELGEFDARPFRML